MRILCLLLFFLSFTGFVEGAEKPNFLFIMADDCTFRDIGCYGGQAKTPHIDKLASEGLQFERCFQAAPMCSPTRHNLYTGLYPVKSGAYPNHTFAKEGTKSVVHYLKRLGYRVALSGKTHIKPKEVFPFEYSSKGNNPDLEEVDRLFGECSREKTPFCLFACSNEPHSPWNKGDVSRYDADKVKLPPYYVDTPETRDAFVRYLAEISYYDWQVGELLKRLDKHGLAGNTMVMVVSEQGNALPFAKWTCYENGVQSAMIVRWPGKVKEGTTTAAMVEYVDVLPTFIGAAGGKSVPALDGRSFLPVIKGKADRHKDYVYAEMTTRGIINGSDTFGIRSVRGERYKYILNFTPKIEFRNACTKSKEFQSWVAKAEAGDKDAADKVRRYRHRKGVEVYDLKNDPYEWHNLAGKPEMYEIETGLRAKLDAWMLAQGDKGQATEVAARERQGGGRKKKGKRAGKKDKEVGS
ncbi:MAG: sulfatase [Verrucomicrobiaceae bacterium]|nr:sulfatase [Verrucomicrobiaceae bacterium]